MTRIPTKLKPWFEARRRFKLSHAHTHMARELGMNPRKLGSLAGGGQEPWKLPPRAGILPLRFAHPAVLFALNSPSVICYLRSVPLIQLLELTDTIPSGHRTG